MKELYTTQNKETIIETLQLQIDPSSSYCLVENGQPGIENMINIFFDPNKLDLTKQHLKDCGYYVKDPIHHIIGKKDGDRHIIPLKDIIYIEGINNDTYIHTYKEMYDIQEKLYQLEERLPDNQFIRISKSYMVSLYRIEKIKTSFQGRLKLILVNGITLDVTRHYVKAFKHVLGM